eukprot:4407871-Prymnesium_polylepis.1
MAATLSSAPTFFLTSAIEASFDEYVVNVVRTLEATISSSTCLASTPTVLAKAVIICGRAGSYISGTPDSTASSLVRKQSFVLSTPGSLVGAVWGPGEGSGNTHAPTLVAPVMASVEVPNGQRRLSQREAPTVSTEAQGPRTRARCGPVRFNNVCQGPCCSHQAVPLEAPGLGLKVFSGHSWHEPSNDRQVPALHVCGTSGGAGADGGIDGRGGGMSGGVAGEGNGGNVGDGGGGDGGGGSVGDG